MDEEPPSGFNTIGSKYQKINRRIRLKSSKDRRNDSCSAEHIIKQNTSIPSTTQESRGRPKGVDLLPLDKLFPEIEDIQRDKMQTMDSNEKQSFNAGTDSVQKQIGREDSWQLSERIKADEMIQSHRQEAIGGESRNCSQSTLKAVEVPSRIKQDKIDQMEIKENFFKNAQ